ncbi:MAG: DUF4339 domain-containing protein [Planctomycetia bacterium]|nr:DUF4339 domain-containing protein [Planctomycetia bacterium]
MSAPSSECATWYVFTHVGQRYGPISRAELDQWAAQNRLTAQCQVFQEGWPAWKFAPEVFPSLLSPTAAAGMTAAARQNPYVSPAAAVYASTPMQAATFKAPHRGTLILVLGILSVTACVFCGPFAWAMGRNDLKEMAAGRMQTDSNGQGLTQAGMIVGMVGTALMIVNLLLIAAYVTLIIAVNA